MKKNILFLIFFSLFFLTSCGSLAPFAEKSLAEKNLNRARQVEAENFSPKLYQNAIQSYEKGEELIVTNGKHSDNDKSREEYLSSVMASIKAYSNALDPFVERHINKTEEEIESARLEKVDKASPKMFNTSETLNQKAKENLARSQYFIALTNTAKSQKKIVEAISNTTYFKEQVTVMEEKTDKLMELAVEKKMNVAIPEDYETHLEEKKRIESQNEEGYYPKSLEEYPVLLEGIEESLERVEAKRLLALKEFQEASEVVEEIKSTSKKVEQEIQEINKHDQPSLDSLQKKN